MEKLNNGQNEGNPSSQGRDHIMRKYPYQITLLFSVSQFSYSFKGRLTIAYLIIGVDFLKVSMKISNKLIQHKIKTHAIKSTIADNLRSSYRS